jgi:hypothetical protein
MQQTLAFIILLVLSSCSSDFQKKGELKQRGEIITRRHDEFAFTFPNPEHVQPEHYPWETSLAGNHPRITKEHFRCKGSNSNPVRIGMVEGKSTPFYDCGGSAKHSLPLRNGNEFVYPILIDLLNYIQTKTGQSVVITCGHRCPIHNTYSDPNNEHSKHMVGAEVAFYVKGKEQKPEAIVELIKQYYANHTNAQYREFKRYEKADSGVSTKPWYNKEIYIKLFKTNEGRNFDNRHPYPYISMQVRHDAELNQRVIYDWNAANKNFLRN